MDIKQLTYFITIVEEGNITRAANKLHMAQPPLSTQLKLLEDELGIKLIERGARKINLTDAGKILYKRAKYILEITNSTTKEIEEFRTLRLGTISSSVTALLSSRVIEFNKKYPNIKFEIHEGNTYEVIEMINAGIIEVGIVRTPFNSQNLECLFLENEPMVAVMSYDYNFESKTDEILLEDLKDMPLIIYRRFEKILFTEFLELGMEPNIFCINDDARTTILWARAGLGIGIVPKSAINFEFMDNIKYIEINKDSLRTQISAIYIKERYLSMSAKKFLEFFI
jgi:DNA-binding transcriptional LysR family regulator